MRRSPVALVVVLALVAVACDSDDVSSGTTTSSAPITSTTAAPSPTTTTTEPGPQPLRIWADPTRAGVLEQAAAGLEVDVEVVELAQMRQRLATTPNAEQPDIVVGSHAWTGELVAADLIAPVELGAREGDFVPVALDAFSAAGQIYGLPYSLEAVAMYYNRDLITEPPTTFEEVTTSCDGLTGLENCFGVPGGAGGADAYSNYPFVSALGGYLFGYADRTFDPTDVGLDGDEAVAGATFLEGLVSAGYVAPTDYPGARDLFLAARQPFWMTGPWELPALQEMDFNYGVAPIPALDDGAPAPLVAAQGMFLTASSPQPDVATQFLLDVVATTDTMLALYAVDPRTPTLTAAFDEVAADPDVAAFGASAAIGTPLPNIPEADEALNALGRQILALRQGRKTAADAMADAAAQVRAASG